MSTIFKQIYKRYRCETEKKKTDQIFQDKENIIQRHFFEQPHDFL